MSWAIVEAQAAEVADVTQQPAERALLARGTMAGRLEELMTQVDPAAEVVAVPEPLAATVR